jgi:RNA polymerase sigma-70 factor (ECF subfamily)
MLVVPPSGSLFESVDEDLVAYACSGDREAFDVLVGRHGQRVVSLIQGMVDHRQDAEDLVQEILLRAWRAMPAFRGESSFPTWLHRISVNAALDYRRRRRPPVEESIDRVAELEDASLSEAIPLDPGPDQRWVRVTLRDVLMSHIRALSESERAVLVLRDLEDVSTAQAAQKLGVSEGLVRWRLHRARKHLRARLSRPVPLGKLGTFAVTRAGLR